MDVIDKVTMEKEQQLDDDVNKIMQEAEEALMAAQVALGTTDGTDGDTKEQNVTDPTPTNKNGNENIKTLTQTSQRFVKSLWKRIKWEGAQ